MSQDTPTEATISSGVLLDVSPETRKLVDAFLAASPLTTVQWEAADPAPRKFRFRMFSTFELAPGELYNPIIVENRECVPAT